MKPLSAAVAALILVAQPVSAQTVILVRHAEKVDASADPLLSEPGVMRAQALAAVTAQADLTHVYSTPLQRTRLTAAPAAEAAGLAASGPVALVGPGADAVLGAWPAGASPPVILDEAAYPDIAVVARLGAAADPSTAPCRPLYLKAVDAKPQASAPLFGSAR